MKPGEKRLLLVIFMLIFTAGCSADTEESFQQEAVLCRNHYLQQSQATGLCHITADYGERVYEFSLAVELEQVEGQWHSHFTLTSPASLAGIQLSQEGIGKDTRLQWDDVILETGDLNDQGLSPMTAFPLLWENLLQGYVETSKKVSRTTLNGEESLLQLQCRDPDGVVGQGQEVILWVSDLDYSLLGGEIYENGKRVITCDVEYFSSIP